MVYTHGFQWNYDIDVAGDTVDTLVTNVPSAVDQWISDIKRIHRHRLHRLVVGLDTEWRPTDHRGGYRNPVATLQLCVGRRCLILQLLRASFLPDSLRDFLSDSNFTFVGVGVSDDVAKLGEDHGLSVAVSVDLGALAAEARGDRDLKGFGLKKLAWEILDVEMEKPRDIAVSEWDVVNLSYEQVKYACADAFVSFEIGRVLKAWNY